MVRHHPKVNTAWLTAAILKIFPFMEAIQDMTIITMEGESELVCDQSNGVISNALTIHNADFKGTPLLDVQYLRNDTKYL